MIFKNIIEIPAFRVQAGQKPEKLTTSENGAMALLEWQQRCFNELRRERHRIIVAPTGSGKSTVAKAFACDELITDPSMRVVVTVPQTMIARSFAPVVLQLGHRTVSWSAWHNLTDASPQTIRRLINFLRAPPAGEMAKRTLICTHQTLVMAHQRLMADHSAAVSPWADVSLFIDESHHCENDAADATNQLGHVVDYWLNADPGPITLLTATWLRGNMTAIVPKERMGDFARFTLSMREHLEHMHHLREVSLRFIIGNELEAIRHIYGEGNRKTLLWLPHVASRHVCNYGGKRAVMDAYLGTMGDVVASDDWTKTLQHLPRRGKGFRVRVLDLVSDKGREERKARLDEAIPLGAAHTPDLLVALNLGKEGFDWPECERGIAVGERGSLTEVTQMMGRTLRDHPGKSTAEFNIVLPYDGDKRPDLQTVKAYIKAILASMVIEWQFTQTPKRRARSNEVDEQEDLADAIMSEPGKASEVIGAVIDEALTGPALARSPDEIIHDALQAAGVESDSAEQQEEIVQRIRALLSKRTTTMLSAFGDPPIDIDVHEQVFGCIRIIGAKLGCRSFGELRSEARSIHEKRRAPTMICHDPVTATTSTIRIVELVGHQSYSKLLGRALPFATHITHADGRDVWHQLVDVGGDELSPTQPYVIPTHVPDDVIDMVQRIAENGVAPEGTVTVLDRGAADTEHGCAAADTASYMGPSMEHRQHHHREAS